MKWINSGGGPFVCSEEYISVRWKGTDGLSGHSGYRNDYEKACSTQEYLEKIVCADGYVLVLGDEPAQSIFFRTEDANVSLAIARWVYAESCEGAESFLNGLVVGTNFLAPPLTFEVTEGKLTLFDSALIDRIAMAGCI